MVNQTMVKVIFVVSLGMLVLSDPGSLGYRSRTFAQKQQASKIKKPRRYSCPMHPEIVSKRPGRCPKCGMNLRLVEDKPTEPKNISVPTSETVSTTPDGGPQVAPSFPDTTVLDQSGNRLRFYTDLVKGKTVAINFIFTTCTTICPPMTATFRRVQKELEGGTERNVNLISVSVDPVTDVPQRLQAFAAKFNAGPGWTFVTGAKPDIDRLLKSLGAGVGDKNDHTSLVLIGNEKTGHWIRVYGLAPAGILARTISEMADRKVQ